MLTLDRTRDLAERLAQSEENGRVSESMRAELQRIDREETFSSSARDAFQDLLACAGILIAPSCWLHLNHGIVEELRAADRQLMKMNWRTM